MVERDALAQEVDEEVSIVFMSTCEEEVSGQFDRPPEVGGEASSSSPPSVRPSDLSRRLATCTDSAQLESIVCDDTQKFTAADTQAAFEALVRVCFCENSLPTGSGLIDAALKAEQPAPDHVEAFKNMGVVVLVHALDALQQLSPSHVSTILLAMGLLGICVDDTIMTDLVTRAELTLQNCSGVDMVNILAGLAMLEYQPGDTALVEFEKRVAELEAQSQFDTNARGSLLWSFTRLGRESDVQAAFDLHSTAMTPFSARTGQSNTRSTTPGQARLKAIYLHSDDLRKAFHKRLQKCPLLMSRRRALPPKHVIIEKSLHCSQGKESTLTCGAAKSDSSARFAPRIERAPCIFAALYTAVGCRKCATLAGAQSGREGQPLFSCSVAERLSR